MCTWFYISRNPLSFFIERAQRLDLTAAISLATARGTAMSGNIRPTDMAAVLAPDKHGEMAVFPMIWGFRHEAISKPLVNCRVETADQKELWRDSWCRRRCVIPASWYYEWGIPPSEIGFRSANEYHNIRKEKYVIQTEGSDVTYLAGLYRFEVYNGIQVPKFAVLTRAAAGPVKSIHDRMPVILSKEWLRDWVRPDSDPRRIAQKALSNMIVEKARDYPEPKPDYMKI